MDATALDPSPAHASPVMLLLAGAPGSGKSTFSQRLLAGAPMPWQHINQDSIKGGKPGSRQDCIHAAARALCSGVNCVIDRCHTSPEQRADFVELARSKGSAVHCVVLALPLSTCHERVSARDDHPTLQGPGAKGLVTKMHRELSERHGLPDAAAEGLASVCVCSSIAAWDAALAAWLKYPQEGWDAGLAGMAPAPGTVGPQPASPSGKQGKGAKQHKEKEKPGEGKQRSFMQAWLKPKAGAAAAAAGAAVEATPKGAAAGAQRQGEARASGAERKESEGNHGVEVGVKRPRSEAANGAGAGLEGEEGMAAKKERVEGMGDVAGASATAGQAAPVPAATSAESPAQDSSRGGAVERPASETQAAAGALAAETAAAEVAVSAVKADTAAGVQPGSTGGAAGGVAIGGPEPAHAAAGPAAIAAVPDALVSPAAGSGASGGAPAAGPSGTNGAGGAGTSGGAVAGAAGGSGSAPAAGPSHAGGAGVAEAGGGAPAEVAGASGGACAAGPSSARGMGGAGASDSAPAAGPAAASGAGGAGGSCAAPAAGPSAASGAGGAGGSGAAPDAGPSAASGAGGAGGSGAAPAAGPSAASGAGGAGGSGAAPAAGPSGAGSAGGAGANGGGGFVMGPHPGHGPLQALQRFARDPAGSASQMDEAWWDDRVLRLLDKYPKSIHHGLVVARDPKLLSVTDLRPQHLPLLEHMREVGVAWAQTKHTPAPFRMGFHQVPSLPQLHMHVMSQDMDSPGLKNKKHWNSFTSPYFMPLDTVVQKLRESGAVMVDKAAMERLLKRDLVCHHVGCGRMFRTMPELKTHIKACRLPFPV